MSYELDGKLYKKFETESKTQSFQTREFVIFTERNNFSNYIKFQLTQERCNLIDTFKEGDMVKVSFDLSGREWQGKFFTNLTAWRVQPLSAGSEAGQAHPEEQHPDDPFGGDYPDQGDMLPF